MNFLFIYFLSLLVRQLFSCDLDELEIGSDCLTQQPPLSQLLSDPLHFGINKYDIISKSKIDSYRLLLIASISKCNFNEDMNRCRKIDSAESQIVFFNPSVLNGVYSFEITLGVGNLYYNLVLLDEGKVIKIYFFSNFSYIFLFCFIYIRFCATIRKLKLLILQLVSMLYPLILQQIMINLVLNVQPISPLKLVRLNAYLIKIW